MSIGPRSQRSPALALPIVMTLVITGGLLWVRQAVKEPIDHIAQVVSLGAPPPRAVDASLSRVVAAPVSPGGSGGYTFMVSNARGPAAYDPCRPLHVVVSYERAPAGAEGLVAAAVAEAGAAAGLQIVVDGPTDELASQNRPTVDRARYGNRWSPVLVAWTTQARDGRLGDDAIGIGGSQAIEDPAGRLWNVSGMVHLDGDALGLLRQQPDGADEVIGVVVHELLHVLGLGHAQEEGQLMSEHGNQRFTLADGDRRGLCGGWYHAEGNMHFDVIETTQI